jgi:CheY-like chemotaxis protein
MRGCLEREGYKLLEACSGAEAETIADAHPETINILVTDVAMPGMSGIQRSG